MIFLYQLIGFDSMNHINLLTNNGAKILKIPMSLTVFTNINMYLFSKD